MEKIRRKFVEMGIVGISEKWMVYDCIRFDFAERRAVILKPPIPRGDNAFIWRARFFGAFPYFDEEALKSGYWLVHIDIEDMYGGLRAIKLWEKLKIA